MSVAGVSMCQPINAGMICGCLRVQGAMQRRVLMQWFNMTFAVILSVATVYLLVQWYHEPHS